MAHMGAGGGEGDQLEPPQIALAGVAAEGADAAALPLAVGVGDADGGPFAFDAAFRGEGDSHRGEEPLPSQSCAAPTRQASAARQPAMVTMTERINPTVGGETRVTSKP